MHLETITAQHRFYAFGQFRLDAEERLLARDGQLTPLPPKALDLLCALVAHSGQLLTKERLMDLVWPDTFVEENNLAYHISLLRKVLGESAEGQQFIETLSKRGYRFVAAVRVLNEEAAPHMPLLSGHETLSGEELEPVGGAAPLGSPFYLVRAADHECRAAVVRGDSLVLLKGARQVGKSSLLARALQQAREAGARLALTDLQMLNTSDLASVGSLFLMLAELIAARLDLDVLPHEVWDPLYSPNFNFERYLRRHVLTPAAPPLVWGLDEIDRLFTRPFASEVFALFRSWHNARALEPQGPWRNLTLVLAYATEAHLFISDLNQSPFNVGTRLLLEDFTPEQVAELNRRHGAPLGSAEVARLFQLVGGQPYLVRRGLHEVKQHGGTFAELAARAAHDEGPFGDHLRRLLAALQQDETLLAAVRGLLRGQAVARDDFYRLRSAGVLAGEAAKEARLRCQLYADYLTEHLVSEK